MIVEITEHLTEHVGTVDEEKWDRVRNYCFFCAEHNSGVAELLRLKKLLHRTMYETAPLSLEMKNEGHYEGNLSWDSLTLQYAKTRIVIADNYNGIWEMKVFGRLRQDAQVDVSNELRTWLLDSIDECIDDIKSVA